MIYCYETLIFLREGFNFFSLDLLFWKSAILLSRCGSHQLTELSGRLLDPFMQETLTASVVSWLTAYESWPKLQNKNIQNDAKNKQEYKV